jgi:hypothetical protein
MLQVICDHKESQDRQLKAFEKERLRLLEVPRKAHTFEVKQKDHTQTEIHWEGPLIDLDSSVEDDQSFMGPDTFEGAG